MPVLLQDIQINVIYCFQTDKQVFIFSLLSAVVKNVYWNNLINCWCAYRYTEFRSHFQCSCTHMTTKNLLSGCFCFPPALGWSGKYGCECWSRRTSPVDIFPLYSSLLSQTHFLQLWSFWGKNQRTTFTKNNIEKQHRLIRIGSL